MTLAIADIHEADTEPARAHIDVEMFEVVSYRVWPYFAPHHYMSDSLNKASRGWVACMADGQPVGFSAMLPFPHGALRNAWRESRTVILPDFQGLGLGARLSDWVGEYVVANMFGAYYSRTVHPRLGEYRNRAPQWIPTSTNQKQITAMGEGPNSRILAWKTKERVAYSHRYIGYPEVDA